MQMLSVHADLKNGRWHKLAIVLPNDSAGSHVFAETCRKLRERFGVLEEVAEVRVINRWPTDLPSYS